MHFNCKVCKTLLQTNIPELIDFNLINNSSVPFKQFFANCNTTHLIYLIICQNCSIKYIGQTQRTLRERIGEHIREIEHNKSKNQTKNLIIDHFNNGSCSIQHFKCTILEQNISNSYIRLLKEAYYIQLFNTTTPNGLNIKETKHYQPIDLNFLVNSYNKKLYNSTKFTINPTTNTNNNIKSTSLMELNKFFIQHNNTTTQTPSYNTHNRHTKTAIPSRFSNLSKNFNITENSDLFNTLNLGLKFTIPPSKPYKLLKTFNQDISKFNNKLLFIQAKNEENKQNSTILLKNNFNRDTTNISPRLIKMNNDEYKNSVLDSTITISNNTIETKINNFCNTIRTKIHSNFKSYLKTNKTPNLKHNNNITTLNKLQKDNKIVIKKADKTNKLCIIDKSDYDFKAYEHLNNTTSYKQISTNDFKKVLKQMKTQFYKTISEPLFNTNIPNKNTIYRMIKPKTFELKEIPRIPRIYFLPKTHKEGIPIRPIVSGISWLTEKAALFLDHLLQNILFNQTNFTHIPKDSFHFINMLQQIKLNEIERYNTFLVTFDIKSLYTSIPQYEACISVYDKICDYYEKHKQNIYSIPPIILFNICKWILSYNYFTFRNKIYHQTHGIAMGCPSGGSIANLYLTDWEAKFQYNSIFHNSLKFYSRYFDDGFLIWSGSKQLLIQLMNYMNNIDPNIQITYEISRFKINYLDIEITLNQQNQILTRIHKKSTALNVYLNYSSAHPTHVKNNLPYSILYRTFLLSSDLQSYTITKQNIINWFKDSKFPKKTIDQAIFKFENKFNIYKIDSNLAYQLARNQTFNRLFNNNNTIYKDNKNKSNQLTMDSKNNIYFPLTYIPKINYKRIINKNIWNNEFNNTELINNNIIVSYKQPNNVLKLVTNSKF